MSEQFPAEEPETVSSLSQAINQLIDYVCRSQRDFEVRLQTLENRTADLEERTFNRFAQVSDALFNLTEVTQNLAIAQTQTFERLDQVLDRIDEMQSEIRGLQTENRRTLELLERRLPPES
ncbi:hypothetical protein ACQ4M3_17150 [Leptolyngbya sp. AN03gr2]